MIQGLASKSIFLSQKFCNPNALMFFSKKPVFLHALKGQKSHFNLVELFEGNFKDTLYQILPNICHQFLSIS